MNKRKIEQQIYKLVVEVYQDGYKNAITNQHEYGEQMYQKGLNDAWECARKIADQFEHDSNVLHKISEFFSNWDGDENAKIEISVEDMREISSMFVTKCRVESKLKALEQEPQTFEWCTNCREYDQEKHCCHRWSKVIRDTVEEMKQQPCEDDTISREDALMCMTGE